MMVICIKQHLSNIWSSEFMKTLSNTEAKLKRKLCLQKKARHQIPTLFTQVFLKYECDFYYVGTYVS